MSLISRITGHRKRQPFKLSLVVVAYNMERELPRTLSSLSRHYQRHCEDIDYEVMVVDNGSAKPVPEAMPASHGREFKLLRIANASPSPAGAINRAVAAGDSSHVGIIVDGARLVTPGVLHWCRQAFRLHPQSVVSVLGFHLGPTHQSESSQRGYSRDTEDLLLQRIHWPGDGYRLFEIASLAGSSRYAWSGPIAESNCLFLPRAHFECIGGYNERFVSPGGGLMNLDFFKRACETGDTSLVYLAGEGCFHQLHGGVTTGGAPDQARLRYDELRAEYREITGEDFRAPPNLPLLLGSSPPVAAWLAREGAAALVHKNQLQQGRDSHLAAAGLREDKS